MDQQGWTKKVRKSKKKTNQGAVATQQHYQQQQSAVHGYHLQKFHSSSRGPNFGKVLFSKREFHELVEKKPEELILKLSCQINEFEAAVEAHCYKNMSLILRLLMKVSQCLSMEGETKSHAIIILSEIFSPRTPNFHGQIKRYAKEMFISKDFKECELVLICDLFVELLKTIPETCWTFLPIDELFASGSDIITHGILKDKLAIESKLKILKELQDAIKEQHKKECRKKQKSASSELYCWDNAAYRTIPLLPQWNEVCTSKAPRELRKNIVKGEYEDWMHYYDVQFRLLREDFIAPLRKGIQDYRQGKVGREVSNVRVYSGVHIKKPLFKYVGLCHEICFDTSRFQRTNWEHSSRLIFGSLLCLSPDEFNSKVLFATVSNRDANDLRNGKLEVMFQDNAEVIRHQHLNTKFVMVESIAFYEASCHILKSLQKAEDSIMPFTEYIIKNNGESVCHPNYLKACTETTTYNLKFIIKKEVLRNPALAQKYTRVDVRNTVDWPPIEDTVLDKSQLEALKNALTHEVAVVQGPPGTGKTYIGLKIVQALLENSKYWSLKVNKPARVNRPSGGPILIMCFTNHALDQFLEGIMAINKDIRLIRIGSRCKNEAIKNCSLFNVMKDKSLVPQVVHFDFVDRAEEAEDIGRMCSIEIRRYRDPIHDFFEYNDIKEVISEHHIQSLREHASTPEEHELALEIWLGLYETTEHLDISEPLESSNISYNEEDVYPGGSDSDSDDEYETASSNLSSDDEIINSGQSDGEINIAIDREQESRLEYREMELSNVNGNKLKRPKIIQNRRRIFKVEKCESYDDYFQSITENLTVTKYGEFEAEDIEDLYDLGLEDRWELYKYWHAKFRKRILEKLEDKCEEYNKACERASDAKHNKERYALETAHVIGMTTTGAAKYQHVLHMLKPKIVIVEEAAEVLESHIVSALNAGTQHLILIGDHKQLRPKPNDHRLAVEFNLDISLFERLVTNNFPHTTLENQHRMRPEIAELVHPHIYTTLCNHESVKGYPNVKGVCKNLFFIDHDHKEQHSSDLSHANEYESKYLMALCRYLLQQGYLSSQITILVTYTGQLLLMKNAMSRERKTVYGVRLCTVDNFQGEENDIILLSLVRSNDNEEIGFLSRENRVCVALSRAKHGFYCIGNFTMLRRKSRTWQSIVTDMESKGKFGNFLEICCSNHLDNVRKIKSPEDFAKLSPNGGCNRECGMRLRKCGHTCPNKCHLEDPKHLKITCKKPCVGKCSYGHEYSYICYKKESEKCNLKVEKQFPVCGHTKWILCHKDISSHLCDHKVEKILPRCNHTELVPCHMKPEHFQCNKLVEVIIPKCGHLQKLKCHINPESYSKCDVKVSRQLLHCGHTQEMCCCENPVRVRCRNHCGKLCSENLHTCEEVCHPGKPCRHCVIRVEQVLPTCGHTQEKYCYEDIANVKCQMDCVKKCKRDHPCPLKCYQDCQRCIQQISLTPKCGHLIDLLQCFEVDRYVCTKQVEKKLVCGHMKPLPCSEDPAGVDCTVLIEVTLRYCKHTRQVQCAKLRAASTNIECNEIVEKLLICGRHSRKVKCSTNVEAIKCSKLMLVRLECSHEHKLACQTDLNTYKCKILVKKNLPCGHDKQICCFEIPDKEKCVEKCQKIRFCGHTIRVPCNVNPDWERCSAICEKKLNCGHACQMTCSSICSCHWKGREKLPCGHMCDVTCLQLQDISAVRCKSACSRKLPCGHKCSQLCCDPCNTLCYEVIELKCNNMQHTTKVQCCKASKLGPCKKKCKKMLVCMHPCKNVCCDPCTSLCQYTVIKKYPCGHSHKVACSATPQTCPCDIDCKQQLSCGHLCNGKCHDCFSTRIHKPCDTSNGLKHFCGVKTRLPCSGLKFKHSKSIRGKFEGVSVGCMHVKRQWKCSSKPPVCHERNCGWSCPPECQEPKRCTKPCSELCDRPPCNQKCSKFLSCKLHRCMGLCGEPCINVCPHCEQSKFLATLKSSSPFSDRQVYIQLSCEHIFTVEEMDKIVLSKPVDEIGLLFCPECSTPLLCSYRYGNHVKRALQDMEAIKYAIDEKRSNKKQLVIRYGEAKQDPQTEITKRSNASLYKKFLKALKKLTSDPTSEEEFLLFLLIKLLQYSQQYRFCENSLIILNNLTEFLDNHLDSPKLSFQVISDLLSEFYRLYLLITNQLQLISESKVVQRSSRNPHLRISTREFEQLLTVLSDEQGKKLLVEVNLFYPRILNGVWMKCMAGHYYCLPATRSDYQLLKARCFQCSNGKRSVQFDVTSSTLISSHR